MNILMQKYRSYLDGTAKRNTVLSYIGDLTAFADELNIAKIEDIPKISQADIEEYIAMLKNKGMAYSSLARIVASLKKFFIFCKENGIIEEEPIKDISIPQGQRKLPETMTVEEVIRILEAPDSKTIKGMRDKAMLELMYATGMKVSEIINLKVNDVSLKNELVVINSGDKQRFVPIGKSAVDAILVYLKSGRSRIPYAEGFDNLFLNIYGAPLTRQGLWKIIKHYIEIAGINRNITAKTLRHSFALHLLDNGADVQSVSEMMGYNDVSSTRVYFDVMNNKTKEVYRKAHPRA